METKDPELAGTFVSASFSPESTAGLALGLFVFVYLADQGLETRQIA